jgi:glycosyltransferase involved in cell wall biosynthesis
VTSPSRSKRLADDKQRPRVVLTVNAFAADRALTDLDSANDQRRTDFEELAATLKADILDWTTADRSVPGRFLRQRLGFGPVAAALLFLRRNRYDVFWCFSEVEGLLLALLFKIFKIRRVLFIIGVETLSPKGLFLLRNLKVWTHFTAVLPTNTYQAQELPAVAHVPSDKVIVLPYQVDCRFFTAPARSDSGEDSRYVMAVGLDSRDYATLFEAVRGLDVDVKIIAGSMWAGSTFSADGNLPPNVTVIAGDQGRLSYAQLRTLYAEAALAVTPLAESPFQKGLTAIQEAMAMGLPVIVTRTTGQSDVVIDRRKVLRSNAELETKGGFAQLFAPDRADLQESNGFYVGVGDVAALRNAIVYLLREREVASELGENAQRFARELLSLELFVQRAAYLVDRAYKGEVLESGMLPMLSEGTR